MNLRHKTQTLGWCLTTMIATLVLSHGHLIAKEIFAHWPKEKTWEGRLETALYTQAGLAVLASITLSTGILIRGFFTRKGEEEAARKELAIRERHERAAEARHIALLQSLSALGDNSTAKKFSDSGIKPK